MGRPYLVDGIGCPCGGTGRDHIRALALSRSRVADGRRTRVGYDRDLFPHWVDDDRDGCNTRKEVLIAEATTPPEVGPRCSLVGGEWYSYCDDATWTEQTDLDIVHMVPLAEAWDSGASVWTTA